MSRAPWAPYYPFTGRVLSVGGHQMHFLDEGKGETVVMVHGNPTWSFYFRDVVKALSGRYRCIVPDHIGMGLSDKPDEHRYNYTLSRRIDDLEELLEKVAPTGPVTLIVHDWGGMIGMGWAARHHERVARIVALNTGCFRLPESKRFPLPLSIARSSLGPPLIRGGNAFAAIAARVCALKRPLSAELRAAYVAPYANWADRVATLKFVQDIPLSPVDPAWNAVVNVEESLFLLKDVPMFLPWGMRDWVFDAEFLKGWVARFPKAEAHRFEDCGHYLLEDAPEAIPMIADFLARHPLASRA
ncbi:MAG: alpha/beta fold hydrolase [Elusimicrobia bacterium]|nr:alpha/beta fold hydrolase [Elusimicrobiota bacterium]